MMPMTEMTIGDQTFRYDPEARLTRVGPCPEKFREGPSLAVAFEAEFRCALERALGLGLVRGNHKLRITTSSEEG